VILDGVQIDVEKLLPKLGVIAAYHSGDEVIADCPWQAHRKGGRRKFYVNLRTGLWICQACKDKKGSIYKLIMLLKDISFPEAAEYLKDNGSEVDFESFGDYITETLYNEVKPLRSRSDKKVVRESKKILLASRRFSKKGFWYSQRGYNEETIRKWNLRILPSSRWRNVIPVSVDGKEKYVIRRAQDPSTKPKYLYQRGFPKRELLFGLDSADSDMLILCEGPLDAISLWQHLSKLKMLDRYSPVAIFGSKISTEQIDLVERNADKVILFFDNDTDGESAVIDCMRKIKNVPTYVVDYGSFNVKDPGDLNTKQVRSMLTHITSVIEQKVMASINGS